tara:strand:- start:114 stop:248 length:135 start_codon:yes stop_codon:yes gene_type:complete
MIIQNRSPIKKEGLVFLKQLEKTGLKSQKWWVGKVIKKLAIKSF